MNIAIITARGGSKRIYKKNIKKFLGKPIIAYSIEAAIKSGCFDVVMVSTDDEQIAEIAQQYGADVPFYRSSKTSDDFSTTTDVLLEVLQNYSDIGMNFKVACCIYPTAPFITAEKIQNAVSMVDGLNVNSVIPVVPYSFPPQRALVIKSGYLSPQYPEQYSCRSQDLEQIYHDAGQFYAFDVDEFMNTQRLVGEKTKPIITSELEVQDIDNFEDWIIAEMKYRLKFNKE